MARRTPTAALLATALTCVALASVPTAAHAEPLTCQGRAVTVDGSTGTSGDDVMVVTVQGSASSGAGDDVVCIRVASSSEPYVLTLDAGPGDDTVVNESTDGNVRITTILGAGADTYAGNATGETVVGGERAWERDGDTTDVEADTVDTGAGDDAVYSGSVTAGARNRDRISLGDGADRLAWAGEQDGPAVDLGAGAGSIALHRGLAARDLVIDAGARTVRADGRPALQWTGDVAAWTLQLDSLHTTFTGTDADELVTVSGPLPAPTSGTVVPPLDAAQTRTVDLRGGDDHLILLDMVSGDLTGGDGDDRIQMGPCLEADVRVGVSYSCLTAYTPRTERTGALDAWGDASVAGGTVALTGTDGDDRLDASGTLVRVRGLGGDDLISASGPRGGTGVRWPVVLRGGAGHDTVSGSFTDDRIVGGPGRDRIDGASGSDALLGDGGRDRIDGGRGADRIVGGAGRDRVAGGQGTDRCTAEVRRSCER